MSRGEGRRGEEGRREGEEGAPLHPGTTEPPLRRGAAAGPGPGGGQSGGQHRPPAPRPRPPSRPPPPHRYPLSCVTLARVTSGEIN